MEDRKNLIGMKEKSSVEIIIRPRTYVIGAIAVALIVTLTGFFALFTPGGALMPLVVAAWPSSHYDNFTFVMFWPLIFSVIGSVLAKTRGLSKQELTVVMAMVWISWIFPTIMGVMQVITLLGTARMDAAFRKWNLGYAAPINWQWGPDPYKPELWESWLYGGPVPWDAWMPALLFQIARIIPYYLMYVFLASLFRRQFVDIEVLPFPHATAAAKLIDMAYEKIDGRYALFENIWLWLGLLIGFLAIFPYWGWCLPGLGLSKPADIWGVGINLIPYVIIPLAPTIFNFEAFYIGAALLVPLKTLFSFIVTTLIVQWGWWSAMSYLGIWEPQSAGTTDTYYFIWRGWTGPKFKTWAYFWGCPVWLAFGVGFGTVFYPIFVTYRKEFINVFKAILGRAPPEVEAREPLRYRYLFLGFILSLLIYLVLFWYASMGYAPILGVAIWTVGMGLFYVVRGRIAAEFGIVMDTYNDNIWPNAWVYSTIKWFVADPKSPFFIRDLAQRFIVLRTEYCHPSQFARAAPAHTLLEAYKLGALEGVHPRYILTGAIIATVIGVIVALFTLLPMWCTFGALNLSDFNYSGAPNNYAQRDPTYSCIEEIGDYWRGGFWPPPTAYQWVLFSIGVILSSIVWILYVRYPWFPINPGGFMTGFGWIYAYILVPALIAYIVKLIIIRIGGVRLYEEKLMPFAIGLMLSLPVAIIMGVVNNYATLLAIL